MSDQGTHKSEDKALVERLSTAWERQWPSAVPIAHRFDAPGRWIRFHTLPDSKRYADSEAEYREILGRHRTVLRQLAMPTNDSQPSVVLVTTSWSESADPVPRNSDVERTCGSAIHWRSDLTDNSIPGGEVWTHLWVQELGLHDPRLEALLRLVADFEASGVSIADLEWKWIYRPYDGGADVIAASSAQRDLLARQHADWLSQHPEGL